MSGPVASQSLHDPVRSAPPRRRVPIGVEVIAGHAHARLWAPAARTVEFLVEGGGATTLDAEHDGYFSGVVPATAGTRYRYRLNGGEQRYPDPASRFQPDGPHGPSEVVDPSLFEWSDQQWRGVALEGQVLYELHIGTFTREGTWAAAERELPELSALGITVVEVMPVAEFNGEFGWGYDGVDLFAPTHLYGAPDDFRRFVDRAHVLGMGVILDVVYNHLGPVGNYLRAYSESYFTTRYENEWGDAINFDGPDSGAVREFFIANAGYWIDEFHLDGLRLDATQQIFDASPENVIAAIGRQVREAARGRSTIVVAENEPQDTNLVRPVGDGGAGLDGLWNDDFHHSAIVALTGHAEAYYTDTQGSAQEFVSAAKYGYLFQGQYYHWQQKRRGTPSWGLAPAQFVVYLENHDQVANSARGLRVHTLTSPGRWRAMTGLLLLLPATPMLFQGQEFSSSAPFLYFADHQGDLAAAIRKGRAEFLTQFPSILDYEARAELAAPGDRATFERSKLDFLERRTHEASYLLHRDLLTVRRQDPTIASQGAGGLDGAVLGERVFAIRLFAPAGHEHDRLVLVNLGPDLCRTSFAEPLLATPPGKEWSVRWSSEDPLYGGGGTPDIRPKGQWMVPGECTLLLVADAPAQAGSGVRRRSA